MDQSSKEDDLKTQFLTREGTYRLMNLSEYSRPNRVGYTSNQSSPQVRVSIVSLPDTLVPGGGSAAANHPEELLADDKLNGHGGGDLQVNQISSTTTAAASQTNALDHNGPVVVAGRLGNHANGSGGGDRICFNFGKELFVYPYRGIKKAADISKPIDKKLYKGTNPSCHDFNSSTATQDTALLLIGFTTGQIQLVQPGRREPGKLFNEDRLIDKTKVTCLKWLPGSSNLFLAGHSSGHLYLYNEELPCAPTPPHYQAHKLGDNFSVHTCKSKVPRNPLNKWSFSSDQPSPGSINEFCFSPCGYHLAIASQDGFLRVFRYESMELLGIARSYFGGFLCVCWSPDGKYIVVGGEDDLVTIWSLQERRVVARGQGHRSWVSVVAFDPYTTCYANGLECSGGGDNDQDISDDDGVSVLYRNAVSGSRSNDHINNNTISNRNNNANSGASSGVEEFYSNSKLSNGGVPSNTNNGRCRRKSSSARHSVSATAAASSTSYRLGSVSQDTQLCLWDITEDLLRQPVKARHSVHSPALQGHYGEAGKAAAAAGSMRIEVKPSSSSAVGDATPGGGGGGGNTTSSSNNNNNGQTSVSSLSTASSISSDAAKNSNEKAGDGGKETLTKGESAEKDGTAKASTAASAGGGGGSGKQKAVTTISLIGNCVGNNLHKMTMSSSISSTSSMASNQTVDEKPSDGGGAAAAAGSAASGGVNKAIGNGGKSGAKLSSDSSTNSSSGGGGAGLMTLNAFTQRLSNFSFGNDKKHGEGGSAGSSSGHHHHHQGGGGGKKGFTLSKPFGGHSSISKSATTAPNPGSSRSDTSNHLSATGNAAANSSFLSGDERLNAGVTTFDPIKLIGSSACPRFDECPVLEPLVCKKIAHERLTALIFREDCFLTACQDGIIYTWARPGHST